MDNKTRPVKWRRWNRQDKCYGDYANDGIFHGWGSDTDDAGNPITIAIVEVSGGRIEMIYPPNMIFTDNQEN
jgi:hypothetical protein